MGKILQGLPRIKRDGQAAAAANPQGDEEPKIKKELCPNTLTKDSTPIEFRKFQWDFLVYYKESYMDKASPEGQKHYLLKCIDAELGERLLALTGATTPIFDVPNNPTKSVMTYIIEEFNQSYPVTNRQKDFFLQSQGAQQFTTYIDKLPNMVVKAELANATAEDLIVVMAILGCREEELRGDLQKLESPKLQDVIKIGEAYERKTFAEKSFTIKVNAQKASSSGGARPKQPKKPEDPARRKEIERLMKGKCYCFGESHQTNQCSQKGSSLKCTSCSRKGHKAKACYTDMLKKSGAIKTNTVQASPIVNHTEGYISSHKNDLSHYLSKHHFVHRA